MRSGKHFLLLFVLLSALFACRVTPDSASVAKLRWVEHADPIVDAQNALASNDHRLVGVYGYVVSIPGVEMSQWLTYQQRYGLRAIEGTSDALEGEEHARLVRKATEYAEHYNKHVLTHVKMP